MASIELNETKKIVNITRNTKKFKFKVKSLSAEFVFT